MEELVIIGSGPAGLTAAIYAKRSGLDPLVIVGNQKGGQLTTTTEVENFPGFKSINGFDLMENMYQQALSLGIRTNHFNNVKDITKNDEDNLFYIFMPNGLLKAKSIIIATGASAKYLGLDSEKKFMNKGVSACATCDGFFYKGKDVFIIGGGDTAFEEAIYLSNICKSVTIINRSEEFKASDIMVKRAKDIENITILTNSIVTEILGDSNGVSGISLKITDTDEEKEISGDGVFIAIGHRPNTDFIKSLLELDSYGYIVTNEKLETSVPGVFAAGDVQDSVYRQAITSAGDGCKAAMEAYRYIKG